MEAGTGSCQRYPKRHAQPSSLGDGFSRDFIIELATRMRLTYSERLQLWREIYDTVVREHPQPDRDSVRAWRHEQLLRLACGHRKVLELNQSTMLLNESTSFTDSASGLRGIASQLEINRNMASVLLKHADNREIRELMQLRLGPGGRLGSSTSQPEVVEKYLSATFDTERAQTLRDLREIRQHQTRFHEHVVWWARTSPHSSLSSGPRSQPYCYDEVRYYDTCDLGAKNRAGDEMLLFDGIRANDLTMEFEVNYQPAKDWWPRRFRPGAASLTSLDSWRPEHPHVGFVFGVRNVDCQQWQNQPTTGFAVMLEPKKVTLSELKATENSTLRTTNGVLDLQVIEETEWDGLNTDWNHVTITIHGGRIQVKVDGLDHELKAPNDRRGYYGLLMRGPGYAAIRHPRVHAGGSTTAPGAHAG